MQHNRWNMSNKIFLMLCYDDDTIFLTKKFRNVWYDQEDEVKRNRKL